jgi:hypothetical protein
MTRTQVGKILVFVHLSLSLLLAAWAIGLYTQRVNWTNKPGGDGTPGKLTPFADQVKQLGEALATADTHVGKARFALYGLEQQRAAAQVWYLGELDHLLAKADAKNPARVVLLDKAGAAAPLKDAIGQLQTVPAKEIDGAPLQSFQNYSAALAQTYGRIANSGKDFDQEIQNDTTVTKELGSDQGLWIQLQNEQLKLKRIENEIERLKPILVDTRLNIDALKERQPGLRQ